MGGGIGSSGVGMDEGTHFAACDASAVWSQRAALAQACGGVSE